MNHRDFILGHTELIAPPACPELRFHLASEVTPLWQATEDYLAKRNVDPPYWAFPWVGGQALARHVLDNPDLVSGKRILDFAAGCGIVAVACAKAGATSVDAAEIDPMAVAAIDLNAAANQVAVSAATGNVLESESCPWDVIFAGDVCYERPMAEAVFAWLRRRAAQGAQVMLADPGRAYLPKTGLMRVAQLTIECSADLEDRSHREVGIYQVVG